MTESSFYELMYHVYAHGTSIENVYIKSDPKKTTEMYRKVIEGVNLSTRSKVLSIHDKQLTASPYGPDIRLKILYALGFRPSDGDAILNSINVNSGGQDEQNVRLRNIFSKSDSSLKRISDTQEAAYVSAFLETPISVLIADQVTNPGPSEETCWFHYHVNALDPSEFYLPNNRVPHLSQMKRGLQIAKYWIPDLNCFVGSTLLYMPGYVQVSIYVDKPVHIAKSKWISRLTEIGYNIGVTGPSVYTTASPFLSDAPIQIHRMIWLPLREVVPPASLRLYTRVFSPRTAEVVICNRDDVLACFYEPASKIKEIMKSLNTSGI